MVVEPGAGRLEGRPAEPIRDRKRPVSAPATPGRHGRNQAEQHGADRCRGTAHHGAATLVVPGQPIDGHVGIDGVAREPTAGVRSRHRTFVDHISAIAPMAAAAFFWPNNDGHFWYAMPAAAERAAVCSVSPLALSAHALLAVWSPSHLLTACKTWSEAELAYSTMFL